MFILFWTVTVSTISGNKAPWFCGCCVSAVCCSAGQVKVGILSTQNRRNACRYTSLAERLASDYREWRCWEHAAEPESIIPHIFNSLHKELYFCPYTDFIQYFLTNTDSDSNTDTDSDIVSDTDNDSNTDSDNVTDSDTDKDWYWYRHWYRH